MKIVRRPPHRHLRWLLPASLGVLALLVSACGDDDPAESDEAAADEDVEDTTSDEDSGDGEEAADATVLAIAADTVSGPRNIPEEERGGAVCVLTNRFPRNSEIVWRARVIDPATGEELDDTAVESVTVELDDGQSLDMRYGPHPSDEPTDFFWTTSLEVPADHPTGTLGYTITAADTEGRTGSYQPFEVAPSLLTITDEVLETIEEEEA